MTVKLHFRMDATFMKSLLPCSPTTQTCNIRFSPHTPPPPLPIPCPPPFPPNRFVVLDNKLFRIVYFRYFIEFSKRRAHEILLIPSTRLWIKDILKFKEKKKEEWSFRMI